MKLRSEQYLGNPLQRKAREETNPKPKHVAQSSNIPMTPDQHFINAAVIRESEKFLFSICLLGLLARGKLCVAVNIVKLYLAGLGERRSEAWTIKLPFGKLNI